MEDRYLMNRIANVGNMFQGKTKRVLCVCSAGLLRSPTAAEVLSRDPFNFNTRAAGLVDQFALVRVDRVLMEWADEIVCMEEEQVFELNDRMRKWDMPFKPIVLLNIEDSFPFRDVRLQRAIREKYEAASKLHVKSEMDNVVEGSTP